MIKQGKVASSQVKAMSEKQVEIVKLLSVPLSRTKQLTLEHDFNVYADATNFAIKTIYKEGIGNKSKAERFLHDRIVTGFLVRKVGGQEKDSLQSFGRRFEDRLVARYFPEQHLGRTGHGTIEKIRVSEGTRIEFVHLYANQFVKDVIRSAAAEISRHRQLSKMLVSIRGKIPHFKHGTIILSGMLVDVFEKAVEVLTLSGEKVPIPFDKRSRNSERETLQAIVTGKRKYGRVRLIMHKEGFLNIDLRVFS